MKLLQVALFATGLALFHAPSFAADPVTLPQVDSLASLKAQGAGSSGRTEINVANYYADMAGGGGIFVWNPASAATPDNGVIIQANGVTRGRWIRQNYRDGVSVLDFGARCNATADDTAALQTAINTVQALRIGLLTLPGNPGGATCKTTKELVIVSPIHIAGVNTTRAAIKAFGLQRGNYVIRVDGTVNPNLEFVQISNIALVSDNNAPSGLLVRNASNSTFSNIGYQALVHGITFTGTRTFSNQVIQHTDIGRLSGNSIFFEKFSGGGQISFVAPSLSGANGFVFDAESEATGISLINPNFEANSASAVFVRGSVYGLSLIAPRTEIDGIAAHILINPVAGKTVRGLSITGGNFATHNSNYAIQLGGAGGTIEGFSITGNTTIGIDTAFIHSNGAGGSGIAAGNKFDKAIPATTAVRPGMLVVNNANRDGLVGPSWNPPVAVADYTVTAGGARRTIDTGKPDLANTTQVLGTLISDLIAIGLIK